MLNYIRIYIVFIINAAQKTSWKHLIFNWIMLFNEKTPCLSTSLFNKSNEDTSYNLIWTFEISKNWRCFPLLFLHGFISQHISCVEDRVILFMNTSAADTFHLQHIQFGGHNKRRRRKRHEVFDKIHRNGSNNECSDT